jgi:hypothetical protein
MGKQLGSDGETVENRVKGKGSRVKGTEGTTP